MSTITHKVVRGDTLWALSRKYGTTVDAIAKLNNIKNVNLIYVGQVLYISGKPSSSGGSGGSSSGGTSSTPPNTVTIDGFGLQADTDRTIFAVWSWDRSNTDKYEVVWSYYTANNLWFEGSNGDVKINESLYNAPNNALKVRVKVRPISETYKSGDNDVHHWTASWSSYKEYDMNDLPPLNPPTPTVTVEDYSLTARLDNLDVNGNEIEFEIVKNDESTFKMGVAGIITSTAVYSCSINVGDKYKVRARSKRGTIYSGWSDYSEGVSTKPSAPTELISCYATSKTSVAVKWTKVESADKYAIEYAKKKEYFDGSNSTTVITDITTTQYEVTGLDMGERYFFRVRADNEQGESGWTESKSVVIGTKPSSPTTWSSTSTVIAGEDLILYWVHNSEDASRESFAEVEVYYNETRVVHVVENKNPEDEVKTGQFRVQTSGMVEGAVVKWRVRTSGITLEYGDWSIQRTVNVYAPPTLNLEILNRQGNPLTVLDSFPFYIRGVAGPSTQKAISFHVSIIAKDSYETIDEIGNVKMVVSGDEVMSRFYDISTELMLEVMPEHVDLQNTVSYDIICTVAMNSGLSTVETRMFSVSWIDEQFTPNAEIMLDNEILATHIRPYCDYYPDIFYQVEYTNSQWIRTSVTLNRFDGISVDDAFTTEGDIVYAGFYNGQLTHFCIVRSTVAIPIPDIKLSVYRREFDGSFTEIGVGLNNTDNTFVTDPHPSLDYARYRVVAISQATGSVSYTDLPGYLVNCKSVVIQWNEKWSNFDVYDDEYLENPPWSGSMLKLPYNIDVSNSNDVDLTLVKYIGRKSPVSYYGTQQGMNANWNMAIPAYDKETIYNLRRLSSWMGDVYVREPSGIGYWAAVNVSFSMKYNDLTIPITISIVRVEGGV